MSTYKKKWARLCLLAALSLGSLNCSSADEPKGTAKPAVNLPELADKSRRRVYVLHSGLHTILSDPVKNIAAETLREGLRKRGVADKDLVVLDNPFPNASWMSFLPLESVAMFFDSMDPSSKMSHASYVRMQKALQAQGVGGMDELVWIGHSAGGQIGLTMAYLAGHLASYPDLAQKAIPYTFDMVITLGSPVSAKHVAPEVKLRYYYSGEDKVLRWASRVTPLVAWPLGYRASIERIPATLGANCIIRCFGEIEHPYWDVDGRVLDRILGEAIPDYRPAWHAQLGVARWGLSLSELMCRALESECNISVEDPPRQK
jgi:hypothetical protein